MSNDLIKHAIVVRGQFGRKVIAECSCGHRFESGTREGVSEQFYEHLRKNPWAAAPKRVKQPVNTG